MKITFAIFLVSVFLTVLNVAENTEVINLEINTLNETSDKYSNNQIKNQEKQIFNLTDLDIRIYTSYHNFTLNTFNFTTTNYTNNFLVSKSVILLDNLIVNATLIEHNEIKIIYFDFKFLENSYWNITLDFLGDFNVTQITSAQLIQEENNSQRIISRELLNMIYTKSQFTILSNFTISSIMKSAFIITQKESKEDFNVLLNNKKLLDAFEIQFKGKFIEVIDGNGITIFCPNIYVITSHAARAFNIYAIHGNKIFYTIGEIYIFLYWKLQLEYYSQYHGAIPDLTYFLRINGEIFEPKTTVHIRNLGDSIRQFLFCRRYLTGLDSFYVNQSIFASLEYLQDDSVFQIYMNGKFWSHDIHLGELNKEWILNAHTGSLLTLILAKNEGFSVNQDLIDDSMDLLLEHFWDFDLGFNRIAYAIWKNGVYQSFTSKSDNYELLISIDFLMMYKFLTDEQKDKVNLFLKYMYTRYTKLDESYLQTLQNQKILFDMSIFFEENHFLSKFKSSYWYERTLQESNITHHTNYSVFRVFGTKDCFVISNVDEISYNELNISLLNIKKINFYNLTSKQNLIFEYESFDQLQGMNLTEEICLILYFDDGIKHDERINKYSFVYLMVIGQIVILTSIVGFVFFEKKIKLNKIVQQGKKTYQKIKERKILVSIFNLLLFSATIVIPIFLNLDKFTYSLGTVFSIFIRRSILYLNLVRLVLIFSLILIILYLVIQLLINIINKNKPVYYFKTDIFKSFIIIYRLILVLLMIFVVNSIWVLTVNQSYSQDNLACIFLYIVQIIVINIILVTSKILPDKDDILRCKGSEIVSKLIYTGILFLIFVVMILQFYPLMKQAVINFTVNQIIYFIVLLLISILVLLAIADYIIIGNPLNIDLSLFNVISLMIIIYPAFFYDMLTISDISIASFYSSFGIWIKLLLSMLFFGFMLKTPLKINNKKVSRVFILIRKCLYYTFIAFTIISITILFTLYPYFYNISNLLFLFLYFVVYFFVVMTSKDLVKMNIIDVDMNKLNANKEEIKSNRNEYDLGYSNSELMINEENTNS